MESRLLMAGVVKTPWPDDKKEKKNGQEGGVHCYGYVVSLAWVCKGYYQEVDGSYVGRERRRVSNRLLISYR
jgi:hypothetical protein